MFFPANDLSTWILMTTWTEYMMRVTVLSDLPSGHGDKCWGQVLCQGQAFALTACLGKTDLEKVNTAVSLWIRQHKRATFLRCNPAMPAGLPTWATGCEYCQLSDTIKCFELLPRKPKSRLQPFVTLSSSYSDQPRMCIVMSISPVGTSCPFHWTWQAEF